MTAEHAAPFVTTTTADLIEAHRRLARRFHPDWNLASDPEGRSRLTESTRSLQAAYRVLQDPLYAGVIEGRVVSPSDLARLIDWSRPPAAGECMFCSSAPTCEVWAEHQHSLPRQRFPVSGVMCRDCGRAVVRQKQRRTLWSGWWTLRGFVTNLLLVVQNSKELYRLGRLDSPQQPSQSVLSLLTSPLDPTDSVWTRAMAVIAAGLAVAMPLL